VKSIVIPQLSLLCLGGTSALHLTADFEVRNEAESSRIFPKDAKVTNSLMALDSPRVPSGSHATG
jgi:hypothetical protein